MRDERWSEAIAVGSLAFTERVKRRTRPDLIPGTESKESPKYRCRPSYAGKRRDAIHFIRSMGTIGQATTS